MTESFLLDSNALVSYVTDRIPKQTTRVAEYIERASIYTFDKPFYKELKKAGIPAKLL